jgi:ferric-dicitrate binding protein FerR (iron transport regulator)
MIEATLSRRIVFWEIVVLICSLLSVGKVPAQDVVGSVDEIKGTAQIDRDGHNLTLTSGIAVTTHDILHTNPNATVNIVLSNGDRVILSGSSSIVINHLSLVDKHASHFRIDLLAGRLRCTVRKEFLAAPPNFEVHAPNAIVVVHGTQFEMAYIEGKSCPDAPPCRRYTDVSVYKGVVEVSNPADPKLPPVQVRQGYETAVPCELPPTSPAPLAMGELGTPGYQ